MIAIQVRNQIKGYLEGFIQGLIEEHKKTEKTLQEKKLQDIKKGDFKPFHDALLPKTLIRINSFERSFSTKLGTTFEECARIIAQNYHKQVIRGYSVEGIIPAVIPDVIEDITGSISRNNKLNYPKAIETVLKVKSEKIIRRAKISDLFIETKTGEKYFFEIKSPKPNKGQCEEVTQRLLFIHAILKEKPPKVNTFFAMAYNPYGEKRSDYKHSFTLNYLDFQNQIMIGEEFWTFVGGKGTYKELLKIYQEVGKEKGPDMVDQLALNY